MQPVSEKVVTAMPIPPKGNKVQYFSGARCRPRRRRLDLRSSNFAWQGKEDSYAVFGYAAEPKLGAFR